MLARKVCQCDPLPRRLETIRGRGPELVSGEEFTPGRREANLCSWLDIENTASAELSSEDPEHPFERALRTETANGWRALEPGPQLIRLHFDSQQSIRRVHLVFREQEVSRSQEIALFAITKLSPRKKLVRQQWVFSSQGATTEVEAYFFDLGDVTALELEIDPGRHDKQVFASLESIQIG
jgi:hypothetical protein